MNNKLITRQVNIAEYLLKVYGYKLPACAVYVIGEGYRLIFDNHVNSLAENVFYNISYFTNHFISESVNDFTEELENMLYVKQYPFGIIYSAYRSGEYSLLMRGDSKQRSYKIYDGTYHVKTETKESLTKALKNCKVDWFVIIPPRRNMNKKALLLFSLMKCVKFRLNYLENNFQNGVNFLDMEGWKQFTSYINEYLMFINEFYKGDDISLVLESLITLYRKEEQSNYIDFDLLQDNSLTMQRKEIALLKELKSQFEHFHDKRSMEVLVV